MSNFLKFFNYIFKDLLLVTTIFNSVLIFFKNLFFLELDKEKDDKIEKVISKENLFFSSYGSKNIREYYFSNFLKNDSFTNIDIIWSKIFARKYLIKKESNLFRSYFRVLSTKQGFYFNFLKLKNKNNFNKLLLNSFLSGFKYIWLGLRFWIFPLIVFFSIVYFTLVLRALPFNKIMFSWICIIMFIYWLLSGFVFFF